MFLIHQLEKWAISVCKFHMLGLIDVSLVLNRPIIQPPSPDLSFRIQSRMKMVTLKQKKRETIELRQKLRRTGLPGIWRDVLTLKTLLLKGKLFSIAYKLLDLR